MKTRTIRQSLPGWVALGMVVATTILWTVWGMGEMYFEGWGQPFPAPLAYLIPAGISLAFTLLCIAWPRLGGWVLVGAGMLFTAWWTRLALGRGNFSWIWVLTTFPASGLVILAGGFFLLEGRRRSKSVESNVRLQGWRRYWRWYFAIGIPLLAALAISAFQLPGVLARVDDGERGARLIQGNGVTLVWAPSGPGWNWLQPWGGFPSWERLASYGLPPLGLDADKPVENAGIETMRTYGLCVYLDADGTGLSPEPEYIWRMPTVDEFVRSLVYRGENAGCTWDGAGERAVCRVTPDKETPLWDPSGLPVYYWAVDEADSEQAYYISYNGWIHSQPKDWGNPRHGYRCVREP